MSGLEGIPGVSEATKVFVQIVRLYLRDHAELNRLTAGEESSDRQIAWAIVDALADFNGSPPMTLFSLEDLLNRSQHNLLVRMVAISLIESVGLLQTRNHLNYNNGSFSVGVNDKTPLLMNWLQYFRSTTDQMKMRVKVAMNIESIMSTSARGVHSEYWLIAQCYVQY